ncbi:MAG: Bax inhibitor-1/YccA family protein [Rhodospirillales bacterium]|nr:Bax inhibitor-1/YccA family protein [Rhodospirillales bacterium]
MALTPDYRTYQGAAGGTAASAVLDAGLRAYMLRVYNWMASGLLLTGIVAYAIAHTSAMNLFYPLVQTQYGMARTAGPLAMISIFAPLAFILVMSLGVNKLSRPAVQALFWAFCAAMGASLTNIFLMYTETSIVRVFFITAATFAAMSLYGYTTRADLSRFGSFLMMGLIGIILASVVNIFMHSTGLQFLISIVGVIVFTGLTAYDTQRVKASYIQFAYAEGTDQAAKRSVYDALSLYLNFINLFMLLLQLLGTNNRR